MIYLGPVGGIAVIMISFGPVRDIALIIMYVRGTPWLVMNVYFGPVRGYSYCNILLQ